MKGLVSNWNTSIKEISNNVYRVTSERDTGESFEGTTDDPITKLIELGLFAKEINKKYEKPIVNPFFHPYFDTDLHENITQNIEYILIIEIMYNNYIKEYLTGYDNIIKLFDKLSRDSWFYIKKFGLSVEEKNDLHWGKNEISEIGNDWKLLEPYYI